MRSILATISIVRLHVERLRKLSVLSFAFEVTKKSVPLGSLRICKSAEDVSGRKVFRAGSIFFCDAFGFLL